MFYLGIDTTFHSTGLALIDENNRVKFNKFIEIDLYDQNADRFFNEHIKNLVRLLASLPENIWPKIKLICVINQKGTFQSLPVGVIAACVLGYAKNKKIIGVDHEISHLYSVWLERKDNQFNFPFISLSVSGAHTAIYFQKTHKEIKKIFSVIWDLKQNSFSGIAALFDVFCHNLKIKIEKSGQGGKKLYQLAKQGNLIKFSEFKKIQVKYQGDNLIIFGINNAIQKIRFNYRREIENHSFQKDLAFSFLNFIFNLLSQQFLKKAVDFKANEIHLVGGVSANYFFKKEIKKTILGNKLFFKAPLKKEFCGDNAAMAAIRGKYKSTFEKTKNYVSVFPSSWYYKYYCQNLIKK